MEPHATDASASAVLGSPPASGVHLLQLLRCMRYDASLPLAIVPEPLGGAHREPAAMMEAVAEKIWTSLEPLMALDGATLRARRRDKFLEMGRAGVV